MLYLTANEVKEILRIKDTRLLEMEKVVILNPL